MLLSLDGSYIFHAFEIPAIVTLANVGLHAPSFQALIDARCNGM